MAQTPAPPVLNLNVTRLDTVQLGWPTTVSSSMYAGQYKSQSSYNALRAWQFNSMWQNFNDSTAVNGASVSVDSTGSGPNLTDPSQFQFTYQNGFGPSSPCPAPSATSETCPSPAASIQPGSNLQVSTYPDPSGGVPIQTTSGMTIGVSGLAKGGNERIEVGVTLMDKRYAQSGDNQIFLGSYGDNVIAGSAFVRIAENLSVPVCTPSSTSVCLQQQQYNTNPGPPGVSYSCTSTNFFLDHASMRIAYDFFFTENTAQNCYSSLPGIRISASNVPAPTSTSCVDNGVTCSVAMAAPGLGTSTFSVASGQTLAIQQQWQVDEVFQFLPSSTPMVMGSTLPAIGAVVGPVSFTYSYAGTPGATDTCLINWGDGTSSLIPATPAYPGAASGNCSPSHSYSTSGVYSISYRILEGGPASPFYPASTIHVTAR